MGPGKSFLRPGKSWKSSGNLSLEKGTNPVQCMTFYCSGGVQGSNKINLLQLSYYTGDRIINNSVH